MNNISLIKLRRAVKAIRKHIAAHVVLTMERLADDNTKLSNAYRELGEHAYLLCYKEHQGDLKKARAQLDQLITAQAIRLEYLHGKVGAATADAKIVANMYHGDDGLLLLLDTPVRKHAQRLMQMSGGETSLPKALIAIDQRTPTYVKMRAMTKQSAKNTAATLNHHEQRLAAALKRYGVEPSKDLATMITQLRTVISDLYKGINAAKKYEGLTYLRHLIEKGKENNSSRRKQKANRKMRKYYQRNINQMQELLNTLASSTIEGAPQ